MDSKQYALNICAILYLHHKKICSIPSTCDVLQHLKMLGDMLGDTINEKLECKK